MIVFIKQFRMEMLRTVRNLSFFIFSIVLPSVFYIIFSSSIGDGAQVGGADWKAYYLMSMTTFGVISTSLFSLGVRIAQERRQGWSKLMRITPLPAPVYVLAKIAGQAIINLGVIVFMFAMGGIVKGIEFSFSTWLLCGIWIWFGSIVFIALGVLIGQSKNVESASMFANISHLGLAILGGLWMPLEALPKIMQEIGRWLPTYRFAQGAWNIIAGKGLSITGIIILAAYLIIFMVISSYIMRRWEAV